MSSLLLHLNQILDANNQLRRANHVTLEKAGLGGDESLQHQAEEGPADLWKDRKYLDDQGTVKTRDPVGGQRQHPSRQKRKKKRPVT